MFRELIEKPIDPIPVEYVQTLKRIKCEPDYSLTCLAIALLKPRIENYAGIDGFYGSASILSTAVRDFQVRVAAIDEYPLYCYYTYTTKDEEAEKEFAKLAGFKERKNITAFVKQKADNDCRVFYHPEKNVVGIFINTKDMRLYHLLISSLPLYYPSLFSEKPMTDEDYKLVCSISSKDRDAFYLKISEAVAPYTLEFKHLQLVQLMKQMHEQKIKAAKDKVNNQRDRIEELARRYAEAMDALRMCIVEYEGMKATENYDDVEQNLVEYLATNKYIHNIDIRNNCLTFNVSTFLSNYDEQTWEVFSKRGFIYDGDYRTTLLEAFQNKENRKLLLDNIFSENSQLIVKIAGNYKLDFNTSMITTDRGYDYVRQNPMYKSYLPNPHLKIFSCLGGYERRVQEALRNRNYIGAIELCIASAGSVDLDETDQTFRPFLGYILSSTEKILRTKDGTEMTPEEALVWLVDKEKKDEAN